MTRVNQNSWYITAGALQLVHYNHCIRIGVLQLVHSSWCTTADALQLHVLPLNTLLCRHVYYRSGPYHSSWTTSGSYPATPTTTLASTPPSSLPHLLLGPTSTVTVTTVVATATRSPTPPSALYLGVSLRHVSLPQSVPKGKRVLQSPS